MATSRSRIPSPSRSHGALTPRRRENPRKTRSVCSPARSTTSARLSTLIREHKQAEMSSFNVSSLGKSFLFDGTDVEEPKRKSWWKDLQDESQDVMKALQENAMECRNVIEELEFEAVSQGDKHYNLDLTESSDSESIRSIVLPQKNLFRDKENLPIKQFNQFGTRETSDKYQKDNSFTDKNTPTKPKKLLQANPSSKNIFPVALLDESNIINKEQKKELNKMVHAAPKQLFQIKPMAKIIFPVALLEESTSSIASDKTLTADVKPRQGIRNMFANQQATKRKNDDFAQFIQSDSEDEIQDIPEVPRKFFDLPRSDPQRRPSVRSSSSKFRDAYPSSITTDSFADWNQLPSSTMLENQLEAVMACEPKTKKSRLSELSEADTTNGSKSISKTKQPDNSKSSKDNSKIILKNKSLQQNTYVVAKNSSKTLLDADENANKSVTHKKSTHQKTYDVAKNSSKTSLDAEKDLNKSQGGRNKSHLNSSHNSSQASVLTRSKNKSSMPEKSLNTSINISRNISIKSRDISDTKSVSKAMKVTFNDDIRKIPSGDVSKSNNSDENKIAMDIDDKEPENELQEPVQDDQLNFTLEYETEENTERVDKQESHSENEIQNNSQEPAQEEIMENKESEQRSESGGSEVNNQDMEQDESEVEEECLNKSQKEQNKSHLISSHNSSQASVLTRSKNKSSMPEKSLSSTINRSRNISIENRDISKTKNVSEVVKVTINNDLRKIPSGDVSKSKNTDENKIAIDKDEKEPENKLQEPVQDEDNQLNFTLEHETEENDERVDKQESHSENEIQNNSQEPAQEEMENKESEQGDSEVDNQDIEQDESEVEEGDSNKSANEVTAENDEIIDNLGAHSEDDIQNISQEPTQEEITENQESEQGDSEVDNQDIEQDESEVEEEDSNKSINEATAENESHQEVQNDDDVDHIDNTPDVSHDTTGKNRTKRHKTLETAVFRDSSEHAASFIVRGRNTSVRKTKSLIQPIIEPIKVSRESSKVSLRLSDGPGHSSAEGSGWDSHRTTRKTLRQTFGKDFTPRKSLRALVMERTAKMAKDTEHAEPLANSRELGEQYVGNDDFELQDDSEEIEQEVSIRTRKATLKQHMQNIIRNNAEKQAKMETAVMKLLERKPKDSSNIFKVPPRPSIRRGTEKPIAKVKKPFKTSVPLEQLPEEFLEDMKYKPPKRFCPRNAPWLTKHFYKFVETKLEPKYDYKARVRAEKFAQTLYEFVKPLRRQHVASTDAVAALKHEMARLNIVHTHFEFYNFFWDFMPREVRIKVIPDVVNKIPQPRTGIYSDILYDTE